MLLREIGVIRSPYQNRKEAPRQWHLSDDICTIEIYPEFVPGLYRIEEHKHLIVLYWLHLGVRETLQVHPRGQGELTGVFATRSPDRPNPIGLSLVRLVERQEHILTVMGLDAIDGTPVIDIKWADDEAIRHYQTYWQEK